MKRYIIPLSEAVGRNRKFVGHKAASLASMINAGIRVPAGICLTSRAYDIFLEQTGLDKRVIFELNRKRFEDMRWEEIWDAALRIRNMFATAVMPRRLRAGILDAVAELAAGQPVAIRSASLAEDGAGASFAGLHESFVNISDPERVIQCVQLVWASLWSDAALLYRRELGLDVQNSAMTVVVQRMICGEVSGVGFCVNPADERQAVIESVYGLNQGLVDGDVEPDRYFIDRATGVILSRSAAEHTRTLQPVTDGVRIKENLSDCGISLDDESVGEVYAAMRTLEELFGSPQDVEWTFLADTLYILQSRPVVLPKEGERAWYLTLHRSLDNLQQLEKRIEGEILPGMEADAGEMAQVDLKALASDAFADELERRKNIYQSWHDVYWDECIPFAHGVRLFATVYNDRICPDDPYEFIDVVLPATMKCLERNSRIQQAAVYYHENPQSIDQNGSVTDSGFCKEIELIINELHLHSGGTENYDQDMRLVVNLIRQMAGGDLSGDNPGGSGRSAKEEAFTSSFAEEDQAYAGELIRLARKSYQLRDDDNLYLGLVEKMLAQALHEAARRLGTRYDSHKNSLNPEELLCALRLPGYILPQKAAAEIHAERQTVNARQLRGQPAGKGMARGRARVISSTQEIASLQRGEILVCDAIDPTMTFCIPLVSAIVERRGGMLIHGAIIAREYGIPCVTGIPQATEFIRTGDDITVDGFMGLVINHTRTEGGGGDSLRSVSCRICRRPASGTMADKCRMLGVNLSLTPVKHPA